MKKFEKIELERIRSFSRNSIQEIAISNENSKILKLPMTGKLSVKKNKTIVLEYIEDGKKVEKNKKKNFDFTVKKAESKKEPIKSNEINKEFNIEQICTPKGKSYEIQDYRNSKSFKNEIFKKIYIDEAGEIINFLKKTNQDLKELTINKKSSDNYFINDKNVQVESNTDAHNEEQDSNTVYEIVSNSPVFDFKNRIIKKEGNKHNMKLKNFFSDAAKSAINFKTNLKVNQNAFSVNTNLRLFSANDTDNKINNDKNNSNSNFYLTGKNSIKQSTEIDILKSGGKENIPKIKMSINDEFQIVNSCQISIIQKDLINNQNSKISKFKENSQMNKIENTFKSIVLEDKSIVNNVERKEKKPFENNDKNRQNLIKFNNTQKNFKIRNDFFISQIKLSERQNLQSSDQSPKARTKILFSPNKIEYSKAFDYSLMRNLKESKEFEKRKNLQSKAKSLDSFNQIHSMKELNNLPSNFNNNNKISLNNKDIKQAINTPLDNKIETIRDISYKVNNFTSRNTDIKSSALNENMKSKNSSINNNSYFKEENNMDMVENLLKKKKNIYYCPNCEHCNIINDENLQKHFEMNTAKNIIKKSFDYIANNFEIKQDYLDYLLQKNPKAKDTDIINDFNNKKQKQNNINKNKLSKDVTDVKTISNLVEEAKDFKTTSNLGEAQRIKNASNLKEVHGLKPSSNIASNLIEEQDKFNEQFELAERALAKGEFKIGAFLKNFPYQNNDRNILKIVTHFLDALVNDKISIDSIASPETFNKLRDILIAQGISFKEKDGELDFDQELDSMFDQETKDKLKKLFKKKYINLKNQDDLNSIKTEELKMESRKRFMLLFLIFIQILAEIGVECKERSILLYRVFKLFFVEQERKWTIIINQLKDKINYLKELCKTIIQQKNKHLTKIEKINDVLFANKISLQNLQNHKILIQELLNVVNEKRDQIYLLTAEKENLEKDLNLWVYGFDKLKAHRRIKEKLLELDIPNMIKNVKEEMGHKHISDEDIALLVNTDKFLLISGHRNYFYQQKDYYVGELNRVTDLYDKTRFNEAEISKKYKELKENINSDVERYEKEIKFLRDQLCKDLSEIGIQTEIDTNRYIRMEKNSSIIKYQRKLISNQLIDYIQKIRYNLSKLKPLSRENILSLIPEMLNEKMLLDSKYDSEKKFHISMDEFLLKFMKEKFKMNNMYKRNLEQTIMTIIQYAGEDLRIEYMRKFTGLGEEKPFRHQILDCFLIVLKCLPISYFKLFDFIEVSKSILISVDSCIEIYNSKFQFYFIELQSFEKVIEVTEIFRNEDHLAEVEAERKKDIFFLTRYHQKATKHFENLVKDFKNNLKNEEDAIKIAEQIILSNKEYELTLIDCLNIFKRNFKMTDDHIRLENFLNFFLDKYVLKIRALDFVDISLQCFISIYEQLERRIYDIWDKNEVERKGIIFYKEFEGIMLSLLGNSENLWKFQEYFKNACQSEDKDYLNKKEFANFCLYNKEILTIILKDRKRSYRSYYYS